MTMRKASLMRQILNGKCTVFKKGMHYCCKTRETPFKNCHYVGQGDCADKTCYDSEVTLKTDDQGDTLTSYSYESLCFPRITIP